jgi:hypothetical protein
MIFFNQNKGESCLRTFDKLHVWTFPKIHDKICRNAMFETCVPLKSASRYYRVVALFPTIVDISVSG